MTNFNNNNISLIGTGNLGSAVGKHLISNNNNIFIKGFDLDKKQTKIAKDSNSISSESKSYVDCVTDTTLLMLAVPTSSTYEILENIKDHIDPKTTIIDFSSSKRAVSEWSKDFLPDNEIVGIYPFVKDDTLLKINWGVISYLNTKITATNFANKLISDFDGMRINMDLSEHDSYVALVESMPYILSSSLINLSHNSSSWKEIFRYFGNEFLEFTKISDKDPVKSFSSISTNNDMILQWVKLFINELVVMEKFLENNSEDKIAEFINKSWEDSLMIKNNIDPNFSKDENIIPTSQENMLSLFIGSKAASFFSKTKNLDKDKYGFEKRI
tara:strand:- start:1899 stop:2882 length:984 start_codon:yes stop_codon:yes gene_type:complete